MSLTVSCACYSTIFAVVVTIEYHGPATGFSILRVLPHGETVPIELLGKIRSVSVGDHIQGFGVWKNLEKKAFSAFELKKMQEAA